MSAVCSSCCRCLVWPTRGRQLERLPMLEHTRCVHAAHAAVIAPQEDSRSFSFQHGCHGARYQKVIVSVPCMESPKGESCDPAIGPRRVHCGGPAFRGQYKLFCNSPSTPTTYYLKGRAA
eukprot:CAMPEP_0183346176 /NCGR_PEP_ID=MMETSP0164_2-20130417/11370_1 /TAXON_ID=221442 /ORGANISM="Coccolithus pelagicus ssp braarudi, Strain PLY182g" /LENGTH=119 /DNA_ID=CAMNT_0025517405 /DNA_START=87 /DNA_END=443 /DNA_ORIENTATION=+